MKYPVLLFLLLAALCSGWAHAAPPEGSCVEDNPALSNWASGDVYFLSDLPYSEDVKIYWGDTTLLPADYKYLPAPYGDIPAYHVSLGPGSYILKYTRPGYERLLIATTVCDRKYSYVYVYLTPSSAAPPTTTPVAIKPGAVNFAAAKTTTMPKLDKPTIVAKVTTTTAAQGSGSKVGASGSQNLGAAAAALAGSSQSGSSQTVSSSGSQQGGSSSDNQQTGSSQSGSGSGSQQSGSAAAGSIAPGATGTLSVTTTPAGASIFIDGVQRGVSPADIPGLAPGDHTLLLKLDGYADLSTPVSITAGETTKYNTGLAAAKKSPGFAAVFGIIAIGAVLWMRRRQ
ncbi:MULTISPECIES: PEGA domain-containing protein [unclassified Methanoregula]|uniref:PEGA domain-containing protein n=1 Tax=unclassified Methanoregula TaxID=2649730 RepID=UPI0009D28968|nr:MULTISPECIES: PEGA domain-containing protein [unclassified Methanoregula]OPX63114.1 MAG: PEGA domain protein [Methanoregula sp. PtaB.Bin085]OPY36329.1 MAG: PEGA domain protein [Methanoregula sp. PtaU1.Bin006]